MQETVGAQTEGMSVFHAQRLAWGGTEGVEVLRRYLPLVRLALSRLARHLPPDLPLEALEGRALLALVQAAQSRPEGSEGFDHYARLTVWRALTDCLGQSRHFQQSTREALRRLSCAVEQALCLGLEGREEELASLLACPLEALREDLGQVAALMAADPGAILATARGEGLPALESQLARAVCELPSMEGLVVALYYFDDLTFPEIAEVMEISEPEVEWAFGRAALLLRARLGER
ncbi:MAG TPA: sigma factor-like helix-turn-helix DNA-binding protein [Armatimonadota bacterium]|jgi:RNA polymerase sigma factor for flagellar operon FliA